MRRPFAAILALALALTLAGPAAAGGDPPIVFPAGVACTFELHIYVGAGGPVHRQDLANGVVLSAGRGNALIFENASTRATLATPATGAVTRTVPGADGGSTVTMMGANVLIMWPTDSPPGPSTTLYIGRVVITMDAQANTTLISAAGRSLDVCAAIS